MQPRLTVGVLVLQAERLVRRSRYVRLVFQTTPAVIIPKPQEVAVFIGHFSWATDLVAVEVVDLLAVFAVFGCPISDLRQGFVRILIGIDISIPAVRVDFLQEATAVPNEAGLVFEVVPA